LTDHFQPFMAQHSVYWLQMERDRRFGWKLKTSCGRNLQSYQYYKLVIFLETIVWTIAYWGLISLFIWLWL